MSLCLTCLNRDLRPPYVVFLCLEENLSLIPGSIEDVSAAGIPVANLTAHMAFSIAGFQAGKTVLSPAIGGSVGNAVTQLARALGDRHAVSTTTSHAKAEQARSLGFDEVIDLSTGKLGEGVRRITAGYGSDIVAHDGPGGHRSTPWAAIY
jgi:NADPH2:quinone reductase